MKLLLDQNLSRRLIGILAVEYPDTGHVLLLGMAKVDDTDIWDFAASNGYAIVSKDKDFYQRSVATTISPLQFPREIIRNPLATGFPPSKMRT